MASTPVSTIATITPAAGYVSPVAAVLIGIATYTKPYNLMLALPVGIEPLLAACRDSWWPALRESLRRGLVMAAVVVGLFALNAAITGAVTWGFATLDFALPRQSAQQVDSLVRATDLADQMKTFGVYDAWVAGTRGRKP